MGIQLTLCSVGTSVGEKQGHRLLYLHGRASPAPPLLTSLSLLPVSSFPGLSLLPHACISTRPWAAKTIPTLSTWISATLWARPSFWEALILRPNQERQDGLLGASLGCPCLLTLLIHPFNHYLLTIHLCAGISHDDVSAWSFQGQRLTPDAQCLSQELACIWWINDEWANKRNVQKTLLNTGSYSPCAT